MFWQRGAGAALGTMLRLTTALALVLTLALTANADTRPGSRPPATDAVTLACGPDMGSYYRYGQTLSGAAERTFGNIGVRATTGSVENLQQLADGRVDGAFAAADVAAQALAGRPPFTDPVPVRAVARLYDNYLHLVVPAGSPIQSVADLRGHPIADGDPGSATRLLSDRILAEDGIDPHDVDVVTPRDFTDLVTDLRTGRIAAFFWGDGVPSASMAKLAEVVPIRFITLSSEAAKLRADWGAVYRVGTIPAGTYPGVGAAVTIAVPNLLVTTADHDPSQIERLTHALFGAAAALGQRVGIAAQLDPVVAIYTEPVPLHDGALRFFRSIKADL